MTAPAPIWSERPGPDRDGGPGTDRRTRTPSPSRPQAQRPPPPGEATQAAPPARAPPGLPSRSDDVTGWRRLRGLPLAQVDSVASLVALLSGQKLFVIYISEKRPVNRALVSSFSRLECLLIPMRLGGPLGSDSHRLRPTSEPQQRSAGHPQTLMDEATTGTGRRGEDPDSDSEEGRWSLRRWVTVPTFIIDSDQVPFGPSRTRATVI